MRVSLNELQATARVVSLPLRVPFRGIQHREILLFEGPAGWAEWSPFLEYPDAEAAFWLRAGLEFASRPASDLVVASIAVNATLPAVEPDQVAEALAPFGSFEVVKIKVAEPHHRHNEDLARIRRVRDLYPEARIRLDANGGWSLQAAERMAIVTQQFGVPLEYLEQPVRTLDEMVRLHELVAPIGVKIAADELIRKAADPLEVSRAGAADLIVVKAQPLGGIDAALALVAESGLPAVVSSALESSVGLAMGLELAASLGGEYASGLGTAALLAEDITDEPLLPENGRLTVRRVTPSVEKLERFAADAERTAWWLERLERCYRLLEA